MLCIIVYKLKRHCSCCLVERKKVMIPLSLKHVVGGILDYIDISFKVVTFIDNTSYIHGSLGHSATNCSNTIKGHKGHLCF